MEPEQPDDVTSPNPDDAEGGTQAEETRNAETDENRGKLLGQLQEKAARVNKAEAEAQTLRAERDALLRAQSPAARAADPVAERRAMVKRLADGTASADYGPDFVAQELLETQQRLDMALNEIANMRELDRISDSAEQQEVMEHFNNNRHRLADVKGARAEVMEKKLAARDEANRLEIEKLKRALEATSKRQNPDVVATHHREVTAAEQQARTMTRAEWRAEQDRLEEAWKNGDADAAKEKRRQQSMVLSKGIILKD